MNPVSVGDDLVERLRPKHLADEPLARAVVSQDQFERRRAVEAYLVANNDLKREAAARIIAVEAERDRYRSEAVDTFIALQYSPDQAELTRAEDRATKAEARIAVLEKALTQSMTALDDWLNDYAHDFCHEDRVAEARARIYGLGTIGYIASVQAINRAALTPEPS